MRYSSTTTMVFPDGFKEHMMNWNNSQSSMADGIYQECFFYPSSGISVLFDDTIKNRLLELQNKTLVKGRNYTIDNGVTDDSRVFKFLKKIESVNGVDINSIAMQQVSGVNPSLFSLSKNDCDFIEVEYKDNIKLFSLDTKFKLVQPNIETKFNPNNLSTYPIVNEMGFITHMVIKLTSAFFMDGRYYFKLKDKGFHPFRNIQVLTKNTESIIVYERTTNDDLFSKYNNGRELILLLSLSHLFIDQSSLSELEISDLLTIKVFP